MKNYFEKSNMVYNEIAYALEDYEFGSNAKFYLPVFMPFLDSDNLNDKTVKTPYNHLQNLDISNLGISEVTTCNYIEILVPSYLNDGKPGKAGDEFIVTFIGGNINNFTIVGRAQ